MESWNEYHALKSALEWQVELGVMDALADAPVDRFALEAAEAEARRARSAPKTATAPVMEPKVDPVAEAEALAKGAADLKALEAALGSYTHCDLRRGARNLVFADGAADARVMIVGEAPGRDEDLAGKPFVGRAGQLLDRMLAAINLSRGTDVYITNVLPWRPPQNRDPKPDEIAMMLPFLRRHIALVDPDLLVVMGNISCTALLEKRGITRLRGQWHETGGRPALPMVHPAYLLRNPAAKRDTWSDLLSLQSRLRALTS